MNRAVWFIFLFIFTFSYLIGQTTGGQLSTINIDSPSLSNNIVDYSVTRKIAVYLPPSYSVGASTKKFPAVYFLAGHGDNINRYINGDFQGFQLKTSMDNLIITGAIKEMIFVLLDGVNLMDGSFYENSSVTGNWRDWVSIDVVSYIDNNFRTIRKREARAICGHSMGGFGAVNIGMKNSDTFGLVYSLSPGLYDQNGLKDQGTFPNDATIKFYISKMNEWKQMEKSQAIAAFNSYINTQKSMGNWFTCFTYGYGAAFSPDPENYPSYVKYPYYLENNILKCDSTILKNYEKGYGGLAAKVTTYKSNLLSLIDFTIDYGINDYFQWICRGCKYLSQLLNTENISHQLVSFNGDHDDKLRSRIEQFMLPRLSAKLEFEETSSSLEEKEGLINDYHLFQNYPNPFNPNTIIGFELPKTSKVNVKIYDALGVEVRSLIDDTQNVGSHYIIWYGDNNFGQRVSSGAYFYRIVAGDFVQTKKMILMK
jgi:S-formylglutathione hydrolase